MKIVIASNNAKKRKEMALILSGLGIDLIAADSTVFVEVEEDGETFSENARKKADAFAEINRLPALADDSGLCVDALGGAPGVYSSRYAVGDGIEEPSDADNNAKLLKVMQGLENKAAHFVCALHLAFPDNRQPITAEGRVDGMILSGFDGEQGFGYDPLFYSIELNKSFAHATAEEKSSVSHRGRALRAFAKQIVEQMKSVV
ncbi:MAG: RdgB/HAM1 family non-canonical purine NTP pyrophosphatase [Mariprofundaceae bacterium]